jgi:long-chain acyl-CoA synthetase
MPARPWLAHYDPGVPATLAPYPTETLVDLVRRQARSGRTPRRCGSRAR